MEDKEKSVPFWDNIFKKKKEKESDIITILKKIPVFSTLGRNEIKKLSMIVYERKYQADEYFFEKGNPGAAMFIIKDGTISIETIEDSGEILCLANLKAGDFLGELALLNDSPRSAGARCITKTSVIVLFRNDLFDLTMREPVMGSKIFKELAILIGERLKDTNSALLTTRRELDKEHKGSK